MKFSVVIGNPPYHIIQKGHYHPLYSKFIDLSQQLGFQFIFIVPARFLFRAGNTPKAWIQKMLNDPCLRVLYFEKNSTKVFSNAIDCKGGVCILAWDFFIKGRPINIYIPHEQLQSIVNKVASSNKQGQQFLPSIMYLQNHFNLKKLDQYYEDLNRTDSRVGTDAFKYDIFTRKSTNSQDIKMLGVINNKRCFRYVDQKYLNLNYSNINGYKVLVPKASGDLKSGKVLGTPVLVTPKVGYTSTFLGIGCFQSKVEAKNALSYIRTKFVRVLISVLKVTQDNNRKVFQLVPLQDFTKESDINWDTTIAEIDQQLYTKYNLSDDEIEFIENNVKPMK